MSATFLIGFNDELQKIASVGGILRGAGKLVVKHPLATAMAGMTVAGTAMAARGAYKEGLRGGEKPRYLAAAVDPVTGRGAASEAAYTNYHPMFGENNHKPSRRQMRSMHRWYAHPSKFKR